jgi:hypothetical protein
MRAYFRNALKGVVELGVGVGRDLDVKLARAVQQILRPQSSLAHCLTRDRLFLG